MLFKKLAALGSMTRPLEWSKTLANMVLGAFLAVQGLPDIGLFLIGFIAAGPLLWSGLYILNDITDIEKDKKHPIKKHRPLPSGFVSKNLALAFALILILASLAIGYSISFFFFVCLVAMLVNQSLYTLKPFRLKERPVLDLISGSMINPLFRFFSGWTLFALNFNAPLLFLLFIVGIQFSGFTLYRLSGKKIEKKLGYKSSVIVFKEKTLKNLAYAAGIIGALSYVLITLTQDFLPSLAFLGSLPLMFIWLAVLSAFAAPLYAQAVLKPEKMDLKKMYNLIYIHNILFIIGFVLLWLV